MPEPKRPLKVFLSYASQDKPLVRELSRQLTSEGWIDTWQDEKSLLPGQDWRVKIEEAVEDADVVIICLSNHSVNKEGHVQKELRYAREIALEKPDDAIFLIPLRLDECEVPRGLRFYQWVDYFDDKKEHAYQNLLLSLKLKYKQIEEKREAAEQARLKGEEKERQRIEKEKAEKEAFERAKLEAEKKERLRIAKEKAEREVAEKVTLDKAEKEAAEKALLETEELEKQKAAEEKAERERKEKKLREKRAHETREKIRREAEIRQEKPQTLKPKTGGQIVYWFGGFIVVVLGIILLSSLNNPPPTPQPTPENTETQAFVTLTQDNTELGAIATPFDSVVPTSPISEGPQVFVNCWYNIQRGDTLYSIAQKFGVPDHWKEIKCDPNYSTGCNITQSPNIQIGWKVIIPNVNEDMCGANGGIPQEPSETALPAEITDAQVITMRLVPEGEFTMGSNANEDENPIHQVYLDAFYMDIYEVTNAAYKRCVDVGVCDPPNQSTSSTHNSYYGNSQFDEYPVIYVDWNMSKTYCEWRGANLPTEAQWEKAARGTDGRTYPWGEGISCSLANYFYGTEDYGTENCVGDTTQVGSYENGKSLYGIYDLAGNVWEWVAGWYDAYPDNTISSDFYGTKYRVLRGGSWYFVGRDVRSADRGAYPPDLIGFNVGFRCAKDVDP